MPEQLPYEVKFARFIDMCAKAKAQGVDTVIVHHPQVLGDTYAEIIESLNRLAAAELRLAIVPSNRRGASPKRG